jgi:hypothetical protein
MLNRLIVYTILTIWIIGVLIIQTKRLTVKTNKVLLDK